MKIKIALPIIFILTFVLVSYSSYMNKSLMVKRIRGYDVETIITQYFRKYQKFPDIPDLIEYVDVLELSESLKNLDCDLYILSDTIYIADREFDVENSTEFLRYSYFDFLFNKGGDIFFKFSKPNQKTIYNKLTVYNSDEELIENISDNEVIKTIVDNWWKEYLNKKFSINYGVNAVAIKEESVKSLVVFDFKKEEVKIFEGVNSYNSIELNRSVFDAFIDSKRFSKIIYPVIMPRDTSSFVFIPNQESL